MQPCLRHIPDPVTGGSLSLIRRTLFHGGGTCPLERLPGACVLFLGGGRMSRGEIVVFGGVVW